MYYNGMFFNEESIDKDADLFTLHLKRLEKRDTFNELCEKIGAKSCMIDMTEACSPGYDIVEYLSTSKGDEFPSIVSNRNTDAFKGRLFPDRPTYFIWVVKQ